ncbi:chemotaxis protein CheW [Sulfurimonas sp. MAG313]|nr:chemotaxis protein CheW [Sulfurimonas sp. MAG313]MDF1881123.1 chemotaxis protein CheW [Sulfurimonas sp. MAG313]
MADIIEEVLIIKEQDCFYGINTNEVEQILRVLDITPMAMTPKAIRGLCSIEGSIISVLDFSTLLDGRKKPVLNENFKARQVSITTESHHFSLLVSEVINSIEANQDDMEYVEDQDDVIVALLKYEDDIIQVISIERLIQDIALPSYVSKDVRDMNSDLDEAGLNSNLKRFLFFIMGEEQYALEVDSIREIIALPENFTAIAESNKEIVGMISLRDDLLVVADLREYYDFNNERTEKNRIIVSQYQDKHIGLVVDDIVDIQDVETSMIEGMPENFKDKKINGVLHINEKLISIVNPDIIKTLVRDQAHLISDKEANEEEASNEEKVDLEVVIFQMGGEEYAFNIDDVSEIIDITEITPVADTLEHIKGVINIRGQVISIASLYAILTLQENEDIDQQIIVTEVNKNRVGFVVDKVNDVRGIVAEEIKDEDDGKGLFNSILQLEKGKRLVMMFDTIRLFSSLELNKEEAA